jgi:hypothetical protein
MLTATQMVAIATRNGTPPMHLSGLAELYKVHPLSLRSVANLIDQQKTFLEYQVRDVSLVAKSKGYADLMSKWQAAGPPSKASLQVLEKVVRAWGGSITYLSRYWNNVGIAGKLGGLAGVQALRLDLLTVAEAPASGGIRPFDLTPDQWAKLATVLSNGRRADPDDRRRRRGAGGSDCHSRGRGHMGGGSVHNRSCPDHGGCQRGSHGLPRFRGKQPVRAAARDVSPQRQQRQSPGGSVDCEYRRAFDGGDA